MSNFDEMVSVMEAVAAISKTEVLPRLSGSNRLDYRHEADDQVVTPMDIAISNEILNNGVGSFHPLREKYPGSFSEEHDSPGRLTAEEVYEIDPIDGTGDVSWTAGDPKRLISPTTLVARLSRDATTEVEISGNSPLKPKAGLIYDHVHRFGLVSDGEEIGLYTISGDGKVRRIDWKPINHQWDGRTVEIYSRPLYPSVVVDTDRLFPAFLRRCGLDVRKIDDHVGGAGNTQLRVFRYSMEPRQDIPGFSDLEPINVCYNTFDTWKTWDTDPGEPIARALGFPQGTDIYGNPLRGNAAYPTLEQMHQTTGYMLSPHMKLTTVMARYAREFEERNKDVRIVGDDFEIRNRLFRALGIKQ